jgi:SAM-dependent methyltransferase
MAKVSSLLMVKTVLSPIYGVLKRAQDRLARGRRDYPGNQLAALLAMARTFGIGSGPRLDVGGGDGRYRALLADGGGRVVEVDPFASTQADLVGDAHWLPIRSDAAGLAVMVEVLEHLTDPPLAVAECYRVLQPGGLLIITTPQYWHVHKHPGDYFRFTDEGLQLLCRRAGFEILECRSRGGVGLILFHAIRVNLPEPWRPLFVLPFYWLIERMDQLLYNPKPSGLHYDALGWSLLARKPLPGAGSGQRAHV